MEFFIILLLLITATFWFDSSRALEWARHHAKQICQRHHVQLLDETVMLSKVRLRHQGHWYFERYYRFEFTQTGQQREQGGLMLQGLNLVLIDLAYVLNPYAQKVS